uniref:Ankyrin repeat domain-containing protein n=1 Tax=Schlesneria paludicola TaxID=360056 RepID=A0A7C2K1G5_9PLAN
MKAGCYLTLALLTGLVLAEHHWLQRTADPPVLWIASLVLGGLSWLAVGAVWNALSSGGTLRALTLARDGALPRDGKLAAIQGTLHPVGRPMVAPLSGEPCVLYEYELYRNVTRREKNRTQTQKLVDFAGVGMAPCEVRAENQAIALYGFPDIDAFPDRALPPELHRSTAQQYVQQTEWEDCSGFNLFRGFGAMLGALTSTGEEIRRDWRMIAVKDCAWLGGEGGSYGPQLSEKRLAIGTPVIAVGVYDAASESLMTRTGTTLKRLQLLRGELGELVQRTALSRRWSLVGGLLTLAVLHAVAYGVVTLYRHSDEAQKTWKRAVSEALRKSDVEAIERHIPERLEADVFLDDEHRTPLMFAKEGAVAEALIARGANVNATDTSGETPLMFAAREDRVDVLKVLIAHGADLERVRSVDGRTALGQAIRMGHDASAAALRAAGARE